MQSVNLVTPVPSTVVHHNLRPASLIRRALVGLFVLFFGTFGAAWLYHSSINSSTAETVRDQPAATAQAENGRAAPILRVRAN
ncbi:MAG TPA: hypothetical protein VMX97_08210 [Hyphomicrobiaceae bacterium]|nr:hypothetical protein [Hyphomicrobiaceae bacterium]